MRVILRCLSVVLVSLGIAVGLLWTTADERATKDTLESQQTLDKQVPHTKDQATASPVKTGQAFVKMRIPRFGPDWEWTALEGTAEQVIADGPGHYTGTALPGELGNSSFAAHRAGHGDPFIDFDKLIPGDKIIFVQDEAKWVYTITMKPKIIETHESWVLDPLPGRMLTLTTCWPKYGSEKRMYIRAVLDKSLDKRVR